MPRIKRPKPLFNKGDRIKYLNKKAEIVNMFWDEHSSYKYELRFIIGRNLVGDIYITKESNLTKL